MHALAQAFKDPVVSSQIVFRAVMDAMAHPGVIKPILFDLAPPRPLSTGAAAVALTLLDFETPVWLDSPLAATPAVGDWLRFHAGASLVDLPSTAAFAFISDAASMLQFNSFSPGSMEYPDRSATLVMQVERFAGSRPLALSGPGIAGKRLFSFFPMPEGFEDQLNANRALFPRGIDLVLVTQDAVAALPRSTRVARGE
jgi:alpha-D-ribose 1-methylphosphonate 5-triphosphate synthase subunit PhnH